TLFTVSTLPLLSSPRNSAVTWGFCPPVTLNWAVCQLVQSLPLSGLALTTGRAQVTARVADLHAGSALSVRPLQSLSMPSEQVSPVGPSGDGRAPTALHDTLC